MARQSTRSQISPAMPRENLEQYDSDFGSSDNSQDSGAMPNSQQQCFDPNTASLESEDNSSAAQQFDGPSDSA